MTSSLFILSIFAAEPTYACTCVNVKGLTIDTKEVTAVAPDLESVEQRQREQNDSALFTGQVIKIEKVVVKRSNQLVPLKKVTVNVRKYWLGVKFISSKMIIYTGVGDGDCGVPYVRGNDYFFWASRVQGLLETGICSPYKISDKLVADMDGVFGNGKELR